MEITHSEDINRSTKVSVDQSGTVRIGTGRNNQHPQLEIPPEDVDDLIKLLQTVAGHKLPNHG